MSDILVGCQKNITAAGDTYFFTFQLDINGELIDTTIPVYKVELSIGEKTEAEWVLEARTEALVRASALKQQLLATANTPEVVDIVTGPVTL